MTLPVQVLQSLECDALSFSSDDLLHLTLEIFLEVSFLYWQSLAYLWPKLSINHCIISSLTPPCSKNSRRKLMFPRRNWRNSSCEIVRSVLSKSWPVANQLCSFLHVRQSLSQLVSCLRCYPGRTALQNHCWELNWFHLVRLFTACLSPARHTRPWLM